MAVGKEMEILGVGGWLEHTEVRRTKEMGMVLIAPTKVYLLFARCLGGLALSWHLAKPRKKNLSILTTVEERDRRLNVCSLLHYREIETIIYIT